MGAAVVAGLLVLGFAVAREPILVAPPAGAGPTPSGPASPAPPAVAEGDTGEVVTTPDSTVPKRVDVYGGAVSILPGQPLELHVSTPSPTYWLRITRFDATARGGTVLVAALANRPGHDFAGLSTMEPDTRTVRANWPVTDSIPTTGFVPGIYVVTARDSSRTVGRTLVLVRTPRIAANRPLYVFSSMTYEAYNLWGGANLYTYGGAQATRVSFDRPYLEDQGLGFWARGDARLVAWLQRHHANLQYTTDYDLSVAPPTVAPHLLILGRHTEYVAQPLRDWVNQHVNVTGDMNVANFGSNSFYWRVRLEAGPRPTTPLEIVCFKRLAGDSVAAANPSDATVKWRDPPIAQPEGEVLGAQYVGIINGGRSPSEFVVTPGMPADLLAGTGWRVATTLPGLLSGEGDATYPRSGGIAILLGHAVYGDRVIAANSTIRTSSAGARVFDAGTFAWCNALSAGARPGSPPAAGLDRLTLNVLAWLGLRLD